MTWFGCIGCHWQDDQVPSTAHCCSKHIDHARRDFSLTRDAFGLSRRERGLAAPGDCELDSPYAITLKSYDVVFVSPRSNRSILSAVMSTVDAAPSSISSAITVPTAGASLKPWPLKPVQM